MVCVCVCYYNNNNYYCVVDGLPPIRIILQATAKQKSGIITIINANADKTTELSHQFINKANPITIWTKSKSYSDKQ